VVPFPLLCRAQEIVSEVIVVGGGLAGGASAAMLARAGVRVCLLEREAGPHDKICGEFLSGEAGKDLIALGLDPARLGAVPIGRVRLISGGKQVEAPLPFMAQGISRKVLDEALLELASESGAHIERGVRVTEIGHRSIETSQGSSRARHIFLATGKHDVRGTRRSNTKTSRDYVGFKMHWRIGRHERANLRECIELVLFDGGYAGLQMISDDVVNLCLILRRDCLIEAGGHWDGVLSRLMLESHLARRFENAVPLFSRPLTIANLPYGYVCDPVSLQPDGVYRLGDQAAMTAPLTGDGMAIALRSAHLAVGCLDSDCDAAIYHRQLYGCVRRQVGRAMMIQGLSSNSQAVQAGLAMFKLWPGLLGALAAATRLPNSRTT